MPAPQKLVVRGFMMSVDGLAAPWHMLEADHKNFFTRWSLSEVLRPFYPNVEVGLHTEHPLRTPEGTPLYYNLFAHAWR